ncbi:Asp/Glu/hydantoin racemase [Prauserella sp. PE36]|uniref:Asp/Glu/hydantoin racemase n=1 Tax=Prauserella endophytica TaxID=1592324 RepID=A0ABY2RWV0_9PSEU|nr:MULTISPECIES: Asp/Glu/hydantoin racemase [Prauserella]PXY26710.1 Asp/Glu/hydantoin racemase [Prauserella coralliicola]RBM16532.1 Asp/Glu/hydantoin racemase [Prauserella sp. PE36]TKG63784.1 Asp/Glu/hydantoin racemase [Prauserella endophytica]
MDFAALDFPAFEGPLAQRGIGVIAPFDLALERELWRWVPMEVSLHLARTPYEPVPVSMEMAHLVSNAHHLAAATRDVLHVEPEVVAYLCTSGSFVSGVDAERTLRKVICDAGAPAAVTTSGALAEVLQQLDLARISVLTPYDADLTGKLHEFLDELGVKTMSSDHLGLGGGIWKVSYRTIAERILAADHSAAEAIFVSCTNLPTYDVIEPLEERLGKPVLTANQLTMWACLKRMGLPIVGPGKWLREVS